MFRYEILSFSVLYWVYDHNLQLGSIDYTGNDIPLPGADMKAMLLSPFLLYVVLIIIALATDCSIDYCVSCCSLDAVPKAFAVAKAAYAGANSSSLVSFHGSSLCSIRVCVHVLAWVQSW